MTKQLYPKIAPYHFEWLHIGVSHQIYVEQSGNPDGIAVLYLHGGPGAGSSEHNRRFFDPEKYRIITFDQRGCGRSIPSPSIVDNTTADLISDIEVIREHLKVKSWLVCGGSWGTTLALCYGIEHSERVLGFILRGVFLATQGEYDWLYHEGGASNIFPEYYQAFLQKLPVTNRNKPIISYHQILTGENEVAAISASKAWFLWEYQLSSIENQHINKVNSEDTHQAHCMALISTHFFANECFIHENYILKNLAKINHIPAIIIHGRYDMVCQVHIAHKLVSNWENAQLHILPMAGHSGFEKQTIDAFCKATDNMAEFLSES